MAPTCRRRVVLAEDGLLMRRVSSGCSRGSGTEWSPRSATPTRCVAAVREHRPDIVVTDVRMPPDFTDEGLRAAVRLRASDPRPAGARAEPVRRADLRRGTARLGTARGVGYLLKDRIGEVEEFVDALRRVADGGTVVDPEVVRQLLRRRRDPLRAADPAEREVLALMAEGRSNAAIARHLVVTEAAVGKHIGSILTKLDLPPAEDDHRRVLAVLAYLRG